MSSTMEITDAEHYAERLFKATSYNGIEEICTEIKNKYFYKSADELKADKTIVNTVAPLNKLINGFPLEKLKVGENAFLQEKQDGKQWLRHYYFKAIGIADINWNGDEGINAKAGEKKLEALTGKKEILVDEYLDVICRLLKSNHPHELAVGLIAASGRRPIEILALAEFTKKKSFKDLPAGVLDKAPNLNVDYYVNFSGQAKRRDSGLEAEEKLKYPIGLLVPADAFLNAFNRLRSLPECLEITALVNKELANGNTQEKIVELIENRRGNSLRRIVQSEFSFIPAKEDEKNVSSKSLRAVYAKLITDRDCPQTIDDLLWASRSIGHFIDTESPDKNKLNDLSTTLNYRYYFTNSRVEFINVEVPPIEKEKTYRAFESDINQLKEIAYKLGFSNQQQSIRYLLNQAAKADKLQAKIDKLEAQLQEKNKEVENMSTVIPASTQLFQTAVTPEAEITPQLSESIKREIQSQLREALKDIQFPTPEIKTEVKPEEKTDSKPQIKQSDIDWEGMSNQELWNTKKSGASTEKIRRSFLAVTSYNSQLANGDNLPKIAITNQVLRDLSRCNGQLVAEWMRLHSDEIITHNETYQVFTKPGQLESYANRPLGVDKVKEVLEVVNTQFLDGQALHKQS